jgi:hypothetical protein
VLWQFSRAEKTRIRPEYGPDDPKPSALSAFRYVKILNYVPIVPDVPTSKNKRQEKEKTTQQKLSHSKEIVQKPRTPRTNGTQKRRCSQECANFRQLDCPEENYDYRSFEAVIPENCDGYKYKGAPEEDLA